LKFTPKLNILQAPAALAAPLYHTSNRSRTNLREENLNDESGILTKQQRISQNLFGVLLHKKLKSLQKYNKYNLKMKKQINSEEFKSQVINNEAIHDLEVS